MSLSNANTNPGYSDDSGFRTSTPDNECEVPVAPSPRQKRLEKRRKNSKRSYPHPDSQDIFRSGENISSKRQVFLDFSHALPNNLCSNSQV